MIDFFAERVFSWSNIKARTFTQRLFTCIHKITNRYVAINKKKLSFLLFMDQQRIQFTDFKISIQLKETLTEKPNQKRTLNFLRTQRFHTLYTHICSWLIHEKKNFKFSGMFHALWQNEKIPIFRQHLSLSVGILTRGLRKFHSPPVCQRV